VNSSSWSLRKFGKTIIVLVAAMFVCLSLLFSFGLDKDKFSGPSKSANSAKWRGVYLRHVELSPVEPVAKNGFSPREAWLESIHENYESVPIIRNRNVGIRLCVRFENSPDGVIRKSTILHDLRMTINGTSPKGQGGRWNTSGVTFVFSPDPNSVSPIASGTFPEEGELTFFEKTEKIESKFRYSIK
jgi:hypothetical protein